MADATVRGGFDTYAYSGNVTRTYGDSKYLRVGPNHRGFLYLKIPAPRGATIVSATLRFYSRGGSAGATWTARRISDWWGANRLHWKNQPGTIGVSRSTTLGALADGELIEIDVTLHAQTVVNGSAHYGWRITNDAAATEKIYGFDAGVNKPTLEVVWSDKPSAPTSLEPAGGAISVSHPVVQFDYSDVTGDDLVAVQVQVDPAANGSSPAFDSGEVASLEPELDLSQPTPGGTYAGLAEGNSTQWRAAVKDAGGLWSDWSDWASISRVAKPALTIDNPGVDPNDYVTEPTPPILWTFTGQTFYQVRVTAGDDRTRVLYDSGKTKGADQSLTLPKYDDRGDRLLVDDRDYQVNVRCWDAEDRVGSPGDPIFAFAWRTFTMQDDGTIVAPDSLSVAQEGETPWVALDFTRATAPDSFIVLRNGRVIESDLDPADLLVGPGAYQYRDCKARPLRQHTYTVKAVENGKASPPSPAASITIAPERVWVVDFDRDLSFALSGLGVDNWRMTDQGVTYQPLGSPVSVRIVQGLNGLEGTFTGMLHATETRSAASLEDELWQIKERPTRTVQLIAADLSIPVKLSDLSCSPHPDTLPEHPRQLVSFRFRQAGRLPFDARI